MDIKTLSERTGITVRRLRYVMDRQLIPDRNWLADEHASGRARIFNETTGVFIACAALLIEAGYKREAVHKSLESMGKVMPTGKNQLALPVMAHTMLSFHEARVQFGDGRFVRWIERQDIGAWHDLTSVKKAPDKVIPRVIVEVNVGAVRDSVLGRTAIS